GGGGHVVLGEGEVVVGLVEVGLGEGVCLLLVEGGEVGLLELVLGGLVLGGFLREIVLALLELGGGGGPLVVHLAGGGVLSAERGVGAAGAGEGRLGVVEGLLGEGGLDVEECLLVGLVLAARDRLVPDGPEGDGTERAGQQEEEPVVGDLFVDLGAVGQ